jgi:hypothetical protein
MKLLLVAILMGSRHTIKILVSVFIMRMMVMKNVTLQVHAFQKKLDLFVLIAIMVIRSKPTVVEIH